MSEEKWHRLPADEIGLLIGKDANATVFPPTESPFAKGRWYKSVPVKPARRGSAHGGQAVAPYLIQSLPFIRVYPR
jgi:hypothetical protein